MSLAGSTLPTMSDRQNPYEGMTQSDIAAASDAADDEAEFDDIDLLSNDPTD